MRIRDKLAKAASNVLMDDITPERVNAVVDAVLDGLLDRVTTVAPGCGGRDTDTIERWLRRIRDGML